jgi:metal-responsive CopG/Arc/MetJ family transcriptional regulator
LGKTSIRLDSKLWRKFSLIVMQERGERRKAEVIEELVRDYVQRKEGILDPALLEVISTFEEERRAFLSMRAQLEADHRYGGRYVAVLGGAVVDSDEDLRELARRTYGKYGYTPIYFDFVGPGRVVELPSPELR